MRAAKAARSGGLRSSGIGEKLPPLTEAAEYGRPVGGDRDGQQNGPEKRIVYGDAGDECQQENPRGGACQGGQELRFGRLVGAEEPRAEGAGRDEEEGHGDHRHGADGEDGTNPDQAGNEGRE